MPGGRGSYQTGAGKNWTAGQYSFAQVPQVQIPRSKFNRSCGLKTAFDSGFLIPIFVDEALPGDTMNLRTTSFVRMQTPVFPIMDNIWLDIFYFSVPIRLVWDNFPKMFGEQVNPGDSTSFVTPKFVSVAVASGSLSDYLGLPLAGANATFTSLWHRAYNLIFNEWFRSQDLTNSAVVDRDDGPDTLTDYVLRRRTKRHDYFTSCLPNTQKGTAVPLPLGTSAPILLTTSLTVTPVGTGTAPTWQGGTNPFSINIAGAGANPPLLGTGTPGVVAAAQWSNPQLTDTITQAEITAANMRADLTTATAATINQIREAFQVQRVLERDMRGGTRYTEVVRSHFGVISPDARLQRPEYLGGGTTRVNVHPVASTNGASTGSIGKLSAFATAAVNGIGFNRSFTEHCLLLGLANIRADLTYQQGMPRMFSRSSRFDFYWPALAHLGEQAVLNKEIMFQGVPGTGPTQDEGTFGYQERYAEYRYKPSIITGAMRSAAAGAMDSWHLGLDFATLPALNNTFIEDNMNAQFTRVLQSTTDPQFFGDFWFQYVCARPMPLFSVPGLVDHF